MKKLVPLLLIGMIASPTEAAKSTRIHEPAPDGLYYLTKRFDQHRIRFTCKTQAGADCVRKLQSYSVIKVSKCGCTSKL